MKRTAEITEAQHNLLAQATIRLRAPAGGLIAGALAFFAGSAILTRSGQPGASTSVPWLASHALWFVATAIVAVAGIALVRRLPPARTTLADVAATGALGLAVLAALQWLSWTYVDVFVRRHGDHELLHGTLLHPYGTAHALTYAVLLGGAVALPGWRLSRSELTHRYVDRAGVATGATSVVAAGASFVTVLDVPHPVTLVVVLSIGASFGWLLAVGTSVYRTVSAQ